MSDTTARPGMEVTLDHYSFYSVVGTDHTRAQKTVSGCDGGGPSFGTLSAVEERRADPSPTRAAGFAWRHKSGVLGRTIESPSNIMHSSYFHGPCHSPLDAIPYLEILGRGKGAGGPSDLLDSNRDTRA
jgi:hypothetical protein